MDTVSMKHNQNKQVQMRYFTICYPATSATLIQAMHISMASPGKKYSRHLIIKDRNKKQAIYC